MHIFIVLLGSKLQGFCRIYSQYSLQTHNETTLWDVLPHISWQIVTQIHSNCSKCIYRSIVLCKKVIRLHLPPQFLRTVFCPRCLWHKSDTEHTSVIRTSSVQVLIFTQLSWHATRIKAVASSIWRQPVISNNSRKPLHENQSEIPDNQLANSEMNGINSSTTTFWTFFQ